LPEPHTDRRQDAPDVPIGGRARLAETTRSLDGGTAQRRTRAVRTEESGSNLNRSDLPRQASTTSAAKSTPIRPPNIAPSERYRQAHKIGRVKRSSQAEHSLASETLRNPGGDRTPPSTSISTRKMHAVPIMDASTWASPSVAVLRWPDLPPWPPRDEAQDKVGNRRALMRLHRLEREQRG